MKRTGLKSIACFLAVASAAWVACAAPSVADQPSYASPATAPSYAHPNNEETIRGRIQSVDGTYRISVLDDNTRYVDKIGLHQGTVITPTGITLEPGMTVTISGYNAGAVFEANRIDTPYDADYAPPAYYVPGLWYPYYGPGWWYPGFGPSFSFGIGIYGGYRGGYYGHGGYGGYYGRGSYGAYRGGYRGGSYRGATGRGSSHASSVRSGGGSHSSGGGHPH